MASSTLRLDGGRRSDLEHAARILRSGGLVAFPTETVYGLGARGLDPAAVARIFEAKGRPGDNPIILHVTDFDAARPLWNCKDGDFDQILDRCEKLATRFWPGPLTIVNYKSEVVPNITTGNLDKVGVRAPDHPVARELIQLVGEPLAAPSANASGRVSATSAEHVLQTLDGRIDAIVDGGDCRLGIESTVVDITKETPVLLRPGAVPENEIRNVCGLLTIHTNTHDSETHAASPGLRYKHYSPLIGSVRLGGETMIQQFWKSPAAILLRKVTFENCCKTLGARPRDSVTEVLPDEAAAFARLLYSALYRMENARPELAIIEAPPDTTDGAWRAVRDRLERAAN
ncbi:MAG: L-threonylcarbamoyladenylate synthase [Planctomycetota bacterium]